VPDAVATLAFEGRMDCRTYTEPDGPSYFAVQLSRIMASPRDIGPRVTKLGRQ